MGIKGLNNILKKYCLREGILEISLANLEGKIIAIDTSIYIYKYTYNNNHLLENFLLQISALLKNKITPLYVFDGKPSDEKKELIKKRKEDSKKKEDKIIELKNQIQLLQEKLEECSDEDEEQLLQFEISKLGMELNKKEKGLIIIDWELITKFKKILKNLGIPYYECDGESDIYIKYFFQQNLIDYAITEDLDFLTHGCKNVLYDFNFKTNAIKQYNHEAILNELNLSHNQFIDLCILMGCDYTTTIKNIGPKRAINLIKEYNNIEGIIEKIQNGDKKFKKFIIPETFDYKSARNMFKLEYQGQLNEYSRDKLNLKSLNLKEFYECINGIQISKSCISRIIKLRIPKIIKIKKTNRECKTITQFLIKKPKSTEN